MRRSVVRLLVLGLALLAPGCRPDASTSRGTAELFLDAHYVRIDLPAALELTTGVAHQKIEKEIDLVRGQTIDDSTRKPTVRYQLVEEHPGGEEAVNYLYHGTILVEDADRLERRWLVTVRRASGAWRVANYQELDG